MADRHAVSLYQPLREPSRQIRLLELDDSRSTESSCPSFLIRRYDLRKAPKYIAFSYQWETADRPSTGEIEINGRRVGVRRNLFNLLHYLAKHVPDMAANRYWVDAQCIDQSNVREKQAQVRLMGEIYSGAVMVYAWLGRVQDVPRKLQVYIDHQHQIEKEIKRWVEDNPMKTSLSEEGQFLLLFLATGTYW